MKRIDWAIWATIIVLTAWLWMSDAEAWQRTNSCQDWANTVEKLETLDEQTKTAVIDGMHKLRNHPRYKTLMKAVMWHKAGQTSEAAWRQCESY